MELDPELKAMNDTYKVLNDLDEDARARVVNWLISKFSIHRAKSITTSSTQVRMENEGGSISSFTSIADLFGKTTFKTESDKVLLVAAYLQLKENKEELTSREINKELNHLGHGVSNITVAIGVLINRKPSLMIQTRKEGKSQQAQKKYKVTLEGIKAANAMISTAD